MPLAQTEEVDALLCVQNAALEYEVSSVSILFLLYSSCKCITRCRDTSDAA